MGHSSFVAWGTIVLVSLGGLGAFGSARAALAGDPPASPPTPAEASPLAGLSDKDVERIALKMLEIQESRRAETAARAEAAARAEGAARAELAARAEAAAARVEAAAVRAEAAARAATAAASAPTFSAAPGAGTARAVVPTRVDLPPPSGTKETRFGAPLLAAPGGEPVRYVSGDRTWTTPAPSAYSSRVELPSTQERFFVLNRAAADAAVARGMGGGVAGPSEEDRRGARLLSARGHSPSALQDDVEYGDRERSLFLGASTPLVSRTVMRDPNEVHRFGPNSYGYARDRELAAEGDSDRGYEKVVPGWMALVTAQGKFSIVGSSASNSAFTELADGRANAKNKGFNVDTADVSNKFTFGSFQGNLRAAYFPNPSGSDSEVELLHAYGLAPFKDVPTDAKERLILRLGESHVPLGFYSENEWETWAWQSRPVVYGRLFNGNLKGMGVDALVRPEVHDVHRDLLVHLGMYNANSDGMRGFLTEDAIGGYATPGGERYTFTDFAYFADVSGVVDLTPGSDAALLLHGGGFAMFGPNGTGANGDTLLYGARARLAWMRCRNATPGVADGFLIESEWIRRDYHVDASGAQAATDLEDWGAYVSAVYTLDHAVPGRLTLGAKWDIAEGAGANFVGAGVPLRSQDPLRADRMRWGALLAWEPETTVPVLGKFAFSLEYVLDDSTFLHETEHSFILGLQVR